MITLIAAIGKNNELGYKNSLLWKLPEDLSHFKSYTMGKVVIMGSNTFLSLGQKPLPGRKNIVISRQILKCNHAIHAISIEDALSISHCYDEIVIIGGQSIYEQTISLADKLVITHIDDSATADVYFPLIDLSVWKVNSERKSKSINPSFVITEYTRHESS